MNDSLEEIRRIRSLEWEARNSAEPVSRKRSRSPRRVIDVDMQSGPEELRVLSWNIDGLDDRSDEDDMLGRTLWVIDRIATLCPHVVFLQELIEYNYSILYQKLSRAFYFVKQDSCKQPYFVAILVHKRSMELRFNRTIDFPTSKMGRSAVYVEARLKEEGCWRGFLTAHLESLGESAAERKSQLKICLDFIKASNLESIVFGGDLNIRDAEVPATLAKKDCWTLSGSDKNKQFTWDMSLNDNPGMSGKPRCRFDRLYVVGSDKKNEVVAVKDFQLVGTERVPNLDRFASDHFGIFVDLSF